jgi:hypothetical protein
VHSADVRFVIAHRRDRIHLLTEVRVAESKFLTSEEVCERYRGEISVGTLRNWRSQRVGPPFIKIGKSVLYPVQGLDEWDEKNLVTCRASRRLSMADREQE